MKTKEILNEWKSYLNKELLAEVSIKRFQEQHLLPQTGEVDEKTASAIEQAIIEQMLDPKNDKPLLKAQEKIMSLLK